MQDRKDGALVSWESDTDNGTEAEHLAEIEDYSDEELSSSYGGGHTGYYRGWDREWQKRQARRPRESNYRGGDRVQADRWRCVVKGCNPVLIGEEAANKHRDERGHRIAKWPVRSEAGKAKAKARSRNGYYDKYNVGAKSAIVRGIR